MIQLFRNHQALMKITKINCILKSVRLPGLTWKNGH